MGAVVLQLHKLVLFWSLFGVSLAHSVTAQTLHFKHIDVEEGLPSNRVYSLYKDSLGLIWAATEKGIARYDGRKFVKFTSESGLPSNVFYDFVQYPGGGFFAFGGDGHIVYFADDHFKTVAKHHSLPARGAFFSYHHTARNKVMVKLSNELLEITPGSMVLQQPQEKVALHHCVSFTGAPGTPEGKCLRMFVDKCRNSIIILSEGGMDTVVNQPFSTRINMDKCPDWISAHVALFFNHKDLYRIDLSRKEIQKVRSFPSRVECLQVDKDGHVWLGTLGDGLWYSEDLAHWRCRSEPLNVTDIEFDNEDGLWISTLRNGLFYCPITTMETIFKGHYEQVHVARDQLGVAAEDRFLWCEIPGTAALRSFEMASREYSIYYHPDINSWLIGGNQSQLALLDSGLDSVHVPEEKFHKPAFYLRKFASNDAYTVGAIGTGCLIWKNNALFDPKRTLRFGGERFSEIALDGHSNLYYSGQNGTFRYNINTGRVDKIAPYKSRKILLTSEGDILLGTEKAGIMAYGPALDLQFRIDTKDGLPSNQVFDMAQDGPFLFVAHANGLSKVGHPLGHIENYPKISGIIPDLSFIKIWKGAIILGNQLEVAKLPLVALANMGAPQFKVHLSTRSDHEKPISAGDQVPYGQNGIEIKVTYASFESRSGYPLRYRMGGNETWTRFQDNATINNIPGGSHTMEVQFLDHTGHWKPITAPVSFEVLAPFWKQSWFVFLSVFTGALLLLLVARQVYKYKLAKAKASMDLKNQMKDLKIKALKAQLNPHFIFNALTSVQYYLAKNDVAKAREFLIRFSKLVRRILEHSEQRHIALGQELALIRSYVAIESERIGGEPIALGVACETGLLNDALISPSILQPYIENAIWHGLRNKHGARRIHIAASSCGKELLITIRDNGIGRKAAQRLNGRKHHKSFGMHLSGSRINLMAIGNPDEKITIKDLEDPTGTMIEIKVPLILKTHLHESTYS